MTVLLQTIPKQRNQNPDIELNPDFAKAYHRRGQTYFSRNNYDRAIADYTKAIELNPDFAKAYHRRGQTYFSRNNYDRAIADYTKATELES